MERDSKKDLMVTLAVFIAVVFIVSASVVKNKKQDTPLISSAPVSLPITVQTTPTTTTQTPSTATTSSAYKDGTYQAKSSYYTPGQPETITVSVVLKDDVITDTSVSVTGYDRDSREYSNAFVQNYKPYVIGKSIASLRLRRVSGASLTSQGFNDAIALIQTQAKS